MHFARAIAAATDSLHEMIEKQNWTSIGGSLDGVVEVCIDAIQASDDAGVAELATRVRRATTAVMAGHGILEEPLPIWIAGQLRGLGRLMGAAAERRIPADLTQYVDDVMRHMLDALLAENRPGLSGVALARRIEVDPATISRKLPMLKSLGLIRQWREGRSVMIGLTAAGRRFCGGPARASMHVEDTANRFTGWPKGEEKLGGIDLLTNEFANAGALGGNRSRILRGAIERPALLAEMPVEAAEPATQDWAKPAPHTALAAIGG